MAVGVFFMRLLELMFFVGIVGSAVVVLIASVGDVQELMSKDQQVPTANKTP